MMHAYNELYLYDVMKNIAAMTDIAINAEGLVPDEFAKIFTTSDVAKKIECGVPDMLAGKSATEMLSIVLDKDVEYTIVPMNRTEEYWAGWILARAQWELNKSFSDIISVMPLTDIIGLYHPYHEADDLKTIDMIANRFPAKESPLKTLRKKRKLTQEQLSLISGVNIRSIRSYEQGSNELSKARGEILQMLSHALDCTMEDLMG